MNRTTQQITALRAEGRRVLVRAGAGTGKTRTLVDRVQRLLDQQVDPSRILVLTFTNFAADELLDRLERIPADGLYIGTIHGWAAKVVAAAPDIAARADGFGVYDEEDRAMVARMAAYDVNDDTSPWKREAETLLRRERTRLMYEDRMRAANALGYSALLAQAELVLGTEMRRPAIEPFRSYLHVLVDEAQDVSEQQWRLIDLAATRADLWAVGDPRQSIYAWRGAAPEQLVTRKWDEVVDLTLNFRSRNTIVGLANDVHMHYPGLAPMREHTREALELHQCATPNDERRLISRHVQALIGDGVRPCDIAILGRTWRQLSYIRHRLMADDVTHQVHNHRSDRWSDGIGRAIALFVRAQVRPLDDELTAMMLLALATNTQPDRTPNAGIQAIRELRTRASERRASLYTTAVAEGVLPDVSGARMSLEVLEALREHVKGDLAAGGDEWYREELGRPHLRTPKRFTWWWTFARQGQDYLTRRREDAVQLLTIHAAKGLEWPVVVVPGCVEEVHPGTRAMDHDDLTEARSVFYVAVTRARDRLVLTWAQRDNQDRPLTPSPFLPPDLRSAEPREQL